MSEKKIRRIISVFLVLAMVFSIFAGMDIVPLNAGDKDNSGSIANCRIEYTDDKVIYTNNTGVVKVTVAAGKDVFPDGTKMELKDTDKNEVIDKANLQITESDEEYRLKNAIGVDINFIDPNGTVTEPEQSKVQVEIELIKDELNGEVTDVLHVVNDKAVKVTEGVKVTDNKADFVTEGVTWRSSDPTKATVDASGLVTGVENSENHVINIIATYKGRDYIRTLAVIFKHYKLNIYSQSDGYLSGTDLNNSYSLVGVQDVIED
ncbi:MAG: Ig-like domain-containing protein [Lachnospiraceae bacterium]|nr:Ig-like domain-containing protein [Lachnospiraceae bacterium]